MIDLTPLDVRKKRGDFKKSMRGYDTQEVDVFLEMAAERLEELVRENIQLRERAEALQQQVTAWSGREKAVQEALVTAQELRTEMKSQAQRHAELVLSEAQAEARRQLAEAEAEIRTRLRDSERRLEQARDALEEMEHRRSRFIRSFRQLLEREMDVVEVEEGRAPLEERTVDLDLVGGRSAPAGTADALDETMPHPEASVEELAERYRSEGQSLFGDPLDGRERGG
ncbi:MAG: DivIVA domain-containing protein [Longimicrobiales bacterium]|nr:DivIVA domain-containing protein [Longimicrobiales bacterium]